MVSLKEGIMWLELSRLPSPFLLIILPLIPFLLLFVNRMFSSQPESTNSPKAYPVIGHLIVLCKLKKGKWFKWLTSQVVTSPTSTFVVHTPFGGRRIYTGDPANVEHILKTRFAIYEKGPLHKTTFKDLFGSSILSQNGQAWKFQRQIVSHSVSPKALQYYFDKILDFELSERLIPILSQAAKDQQVLDLQDILERFAFDNVCKVGFGYDPTSLSPSFPQPKLCEALNNAARLTFIRFVFIFPVIWKIYRTLNFKYEKTLRDAIGVVREFATSIVSHKKQGIEENNGLSRVRKYDHVDEEQIIDMMVTFIYAGRDTTSAALTWLFWLLHKNKDVQGEIVKEIKKFNKKKAEIEVNKIYSPIQEIREMTYTRAALCESMRLYPPIPFNPKQANRDDVLPDGTRVRKGTMVDYFPYAMGRIEKLWGPDWSEFRPERWLEKDDAMEEGKWRFVDRDPYSYPVFQAGPRTCLGKEMAFLQMTAVVSVVLDRFEVVPAVEDGFQPVYVPAITSKMRGGLPVRFQERTRVRVNL